jgi:hypothetical protein
MNNIVKKLENIKATYVIIAFLVGVIVGAFMWLHNALNKYDDIIDTLNTTKQMSLKAIIWNDAIPLGERAAACDVYLNAGYNSLTKKECETIIDEGAEEGIF